MRRTALAALLLASTAVSVAAEPFHFVALGDAPYGKPEEVYKPYEALIATINTTKPALVIHIGDTKSGSTPCSDQMLDEQRNFLNSFTAPVLYSLGDNEWTDCHRKNAGAFDPLDRLAYIRKTYFADPAKSMGATPVAVTSQADKGYPENARMTQGDVLFITAHVVGSNNNFEPRDIKAVEEFMARNAATTAWLKESFAAAGDAKAIVVAIQADMFEFDWNAFGDETFLRHSGFASFGAALQEAAKAYGKPVLLVHGDSHIFKVYRPFPKTAANVTALEVFGDKDINAVTVTVNTDTPTVFGFAPVLNPAM